MVLITAIVAFFKGYSKGIIMALFSAIALVAGLALAIKFSTVVSPWVAEKTNAGQYAPILSFALIFMAATLIIRMAGKALEKTFEAVSMGFVNRLSGAALYLAVQLSILSILLYYLGKMEWIPEKLTEESVTYGVIAAWGPAVINGIGFLIPWFQDMFQDLNDFFDSESKAV